jgi:hypothetical protein
MLNAKMDLLMKWMDDITNEKAAMATTSQAMDFCMTCEVCGNTGHLGITALLPKRMWCSWTETTMVIIHKEVKHGINALIIKEVIKVILSS